MKPIYYILICCLLGLGCSKEEPPNCIDPNITGIYCGGSEIDCVGDSVIEFAGFRGHGSKGFFYSARDSTIEWQLEITDYVNLGGSIGQVIVRGDTSGVEIMDVERHFEGEGKYQYHSGIIAVDSGQVVHFSVQLVAFYGRGSLRIY